MLFPARPRPHVTHLRGPMAVPIGPDSHPPLSARLTAGAQAVRARARTEATRRIMLWLLVTLGIGALALVYLLETSHVASLANQRAALERDTTALQETNARLAAQAASLQTLNRADTAAQSQGLGASSSASIGYVTLPDVTDAPPAPTAAPTVAPNLLHRLGRALTGRASADHTIATATPAATPGAQP